MRIVINASTVAIGGGLSVAHNLLEAFNSINHLHEMLLISPAKCGYERFRSQSIKVLIVPRILLYRVFRLYMDYIWLPQQIRRYKPEWVLSLGNLPAPVKIKQALLFDNPFATLENFSGFNLSFADKITHKFRNVSFRWRLKYIKLVFVQTEIQQKKFQEVFPFNYDIVILPNGPINIKQKDGISFNLPQKEYRELRLLAFSRYYPHKNLEILLDVGKLIKKEKLKISFVVTINEKQGKKARKFLKEIQEQKLSEQIINIGKIHHSNIRALYKNVDGLILPTLLESFSSTYLDAMMFRKPILTSDIDSAREVCGEAGWYFNPLNAGEIHKTILQCFSLDKQRNERVEKGEELIDRFPVWEDNSKMLLDILNKY